MIFYYFKHYFAHGLVIDIIPFLTTIYEADRNIPELVIMMHITMVQIVSPNCTYEKSGIQSFVLLWTQLPGLVSLPLYNLYLAVITNEPTGDTGSHKEAATFQYDSSACLKMLCVVQFWWWHNIKESIRGLLQVWSRLSVAAITCSWCLVLPYLTCSVDELA